MDHPTPTMMSTRTARWGAGLAAVALGAAGLLATGGPSAGAATAPAVVYHGAPYGFNVPGDLVVDGGHLWVDNVANAIDELNPVDGSILRVINNPADGFNTPEAIAGDGTHLWVANTVGNSITELNEADGSLVQTISGTATGLDGPDAVLSDGGQLWVANGNANSITEIDETTGQVTAVYDSAALGLDHPVALAAVGGNLWVANYASNTVVALREADGSLVHTVSDPSINQPLALQVLGGDLWVADSGSSSLTEVDPTTGDVAGTVGATQGDLSGPDGLTTAGGQLYVANGSNNTISVLTSTGSLLSVLSGTADGLNQPYAMAVAATALWVVNPSGNSVSELPLVTTPTAPSAPSSISFTPSSTKVQVSWTPPTSNGGAPITSYTVSAGHGSSCTAQVNTTALTTSTCTLTGLTNGTTYQVSVTATNAAGTSPATTGSTTIASVPGAPTKVIATPGNGTITVSWTAPASNGGDPITSSTVSDGIGHGCTAPGTATSCVVTGNVPGFPVTFTVAATNAIGTGPASAPSAPVTPAVAPSPPVEVLATASNASITVFWQASPNGGSPVTSYTATIVGSPTHHCTISGTAVTSDQCTITGLTNGTAYAATVTATNVVGTSAASDPSPSVTPEPLPSAVVVTSVKLAPTSVTLVWKAASTNGGDPITSYVVTDGHGHGCSVTLLTNLTCTVAGLKQGVPVVLSISATSDLGSGPVTTLTETPAAPPAPPTKVTAKLSGTSAVVSWTPGATNGSVITSFTVASLTGPFSCKVAGTLHTCTIKGLQKHQYYSFVVTATNAAGTSKASARSAKIGPVR